MTSLAASNPSNSWQSTMGNSLFVEAIDRTGLERAQKGLLPKRASGARGGAKQRDFIRLVAEDQEGFCSYVRSWGLTTGSSPPVTDMRLSEREFVNPPWSTECAIASTWASLALSQAARPETWTRINVGMMENGRIKSSFLAASNTGESGRSRIARALQETDPQVIDSCVRTILRRLGGVIERANRTAFLDCPLAKTWWRHYFAREAHSTFGRHSVEVLSTALRPTYRWERLVEAMVSKLTIIGDRAIRPALVECFAEGAGSAGQEVADMLAWVGRRSTIQALGALGPEYVMQVLGQQFLGSSEIE